MSQSDNSTVAHHFEHAHQQFSAAKLGMWLFIVQEILFFSALDEKSYDLKEGMCAIADEKKVLGL